MFRKLPILLFCLDKQRDFFIMGENVSEILIVLGAGLVAIGTTILIETDTAAKRVAMEVSAKMERAYYNELQRGYRHRDPGPSGKWLVFVLDSEE